MLSSRYQCPVSIYKPVSRTKFSDKQQDTLSKAFIKNPYPDKSMKRMISKKTGLDIEQIRVWFQNKRARVRFNMQKETGAKCPTLPTISVCGDRKDKQGIKKTKVLPRLPLEKNSFNEIVNTLQYCKMALSGKLRKYLCLRTYLKSQITLI